MPIFIKINRILILTAFLIVMGGLNVYSISLQGKNLEIQVTEDRLRVFLDFPAWADANYVRINIPFVEYVRDRELADVQIIMPRHRAGQTGSNYVISFIGLGTCSKMKNELKFWSQANKTEREIRESYTNMIKIGISPYVANRQKSPKNLEVI